MVIWTFIRNSCVYCIPHLRLPKRVCFKEDRKYVTGGNTLHDSLLIDESYTSEQEMVVESLRY